jgi:hypothetical protein
MFEKVVELMICDCVYDENGDRWYCEDCWYEDEEGFE